MQHGRQHCQKLIEQWPFFYHQTRAVHVRRGRLRGSFLFSLPSSCEHVAIWVCCQIVDFCWWRYGRRSCQVGWVWHSDRRLVWGLEMIYNSVFLCHYKSLRVLNFNIDLIRKMILSSILVVFNSTPLLSTHLFKKTFKIY